MINKWVTASKSLVYNACVYFFYGRKLNSLRSLKANLIVSDSMCHRSRYYPTNCMTSVTDKWVTRSWAFCEHDKLRENSGKDAVVARKDHGHGAKNLSTTAKHWMLTILSSRSVSLPDNPPLQGQQLTNLLKSQFTEITPNFFPLGEVLKI